MAIDLEKALQNRQYAQQCYDNYNNFNNRVGAKKEEIDAIEDKWGTRLVGYDPEGTVQDINEDEISDEDISLDSLEGPEEESNVKNKKEDIAEVEQNAISKGTRNTKSGAIASVTMAGSIAAVGIGMTSSGIAGCIMNLAIGLLYYATLPNSKNTHALDSLKGLMEQAKSEIGVEEGNVETYQKELEEMQAEAVATQEEQAAKIELSQEEKEELIAIYNEIMASAETEPLSEEDKSKLNDIREQLGIVQETEQEALDVLGEVQEDAIEQAETKQEQLGESSSIIDNAIALTEESASFDEATRDSCKTQAIAQSLNVASGAVNGGKATAIASALAVNPFTAGLSSFFAGLAATAFSGAALSTGAVAQQSVWAAKNGDVVNTRVDLQNTIGKLEGNFDNTSEILEEASETVETNQEDTQELLDEAGDAEQPHDVSTMSGSALVTEEESKPVLTLPPEQDNGFAENSNDENNIFKKQLDSDNNPFA